MSTTLTQVAQRAPTTAGCMGAVSVRLVIGYVAPALVPQLGHLRLVSFKKSASQQIGTHKKISATKRIHPPVEVFFSVCGGPT
jgi:hypothetical protein